MQPAFLLNITKFPFRFRAKCIPNMHLYTKRACGPFWGHKLFALFDYYVA